MHRQLTEKMSAYLTPEQRAAAEKGMDAANYKSASDWLRDLIQRECERQGIVWPEADIKWGDENRIARIRNRRPK